MEKKVDGRGGKRDGSGRKKELPESAKTHSIRCTDEEYQLIKLLLEKVRKQ